MATKTYTNRDCPLVVFTASQNLPPTEALLQTFNSLDALAENVNNLFNRLNNRITDERTKLQNIQERIKQCDAKVRHIGENPNNVCTIYSSAAFPSSNAPPLFKRIVGDTDEALPDPISMTNYKISEQQRFRVSDRVNTNDLFMKLSRATVTRTDRTIRNDTGKEGLGRFPPNLDSTSAVILFNSSENPYKNYDSFNNLDSVADVRQKVKIDKSLAAAPTTIATGLELPGFQSLQFEYRPDMGVLPTFALPTQLGLKNVANINFDNQTLLASIAPSLTGVADLPSFGVAQNAMQQNMKNVKQSSGKAAPPPAAVAPPPAAIAPPVVQQQQQQQQQQPPQQVAVQQQTIPQQTQQQQVSQAVMAPAVVQQPVTAVVAAPVVEKKAPAQPRAAGHGSLLDSIRQGLKLKSVQEDGGDNERPRVVPVGKKDEPPSLQDALFAGIQRHAALMNGKGTAKPKVNQAKPGLTGQFDAGIQKRLMQQASESDSDDSGDDWVA